MRDRIERLLATGGSSLDNPFNFGLLTGFTIITAFLAELIRAPALRALPTRPRGGDAVSALEMEASR